MSAFTPDHVRNGGGVALAERVAAAERFASAQLPTPDEEIWRYSRIDQLDLDRFSPGVLETTVVDPSGICLDLETLGEDPSAYDVIGDHAPDVFAELNRAFMAPIVIRTPPGSVHADAVVITHRVTDDASACFPRLIIDAGENSEVTVVEIFTSAADITALVVPVLQVRVGRAARVNYLAVNELGHRVWQIGNQQATTDRDSSLLLATVALGGEYARVRTEAQAIGTGSTTRQVALYFAGGEQMHDFRTIQDHIAPHTHSDLLFKGAVQDTARSVYTGLIKIREEARGTAAFQTNRNLTLSKGAWAESVPNLDIKTNDVKCSHASTVGPIDEAQRFYLESRGIEPSVAERLVVLGFFDEVLAQLPVGHLAADLRARVAAKLTIGDPGDGSVSDGHTGER
jgi:Fe-S cluster assembly protein SufD